MRLLCKRKKNVVYSPRNVVHSNLLRNYFNHVKNNIEIHSGMDFKEYSFRRRRCVMKDMKKAVAAQLEDLSDVILTLTGCKHFWGEVELPDCMRVEMESESEN